VVRTSLARISLTVLIFVTLLAGVSYIALAVGGDPQTLFTPSIDAAIYSLSRVSIR
jgi:hypothetical protein